MLKEDGQRIENIRLYLAEHHGNYAVVSKFAAYMKEREGVETLETKDGYATYIITGEECYIRDIFVLPSSRRKHVASHIADKISEIARANGCKYLTGSVCPTANESTTSMKVLVGYGMRLLCSKENLIFFKKEIKEG